MSLVAPGAARTVPRRGYDPAVDSASPASRTRASDLVLYLVGVAGIAASITLLFLGMRAVMDVGGMCAEGGAYVIEQHCPEGAALATLLGFLGGFAAVGLAGWKGSGLGGFAGYVVFLAWPALFGALGYNFLEYGLNPPGDEPGWAWGWLVCGVVFEAMAIGPLLVGLSAARSARPRPAARLSRAVANRLAMPGRGTGPIAADGPAERRSGVRDDVSLDIAAGAREVAATGAAQQRDDDALVERLERLAALRAGGALTDEEFARAKSELLEDAER